MMNRDEMIHITLMDGMVRGLLLTATNTVAQAAAIHCTSPVATAALGRSLMGTAMLGAMLKGDEASVTVTNNGLVWIGYPENASFAYNGEQSEHLHIPGVPLTAELAACAEVVIKREEGFVRHPHHGDFILPRIHEPASEKPQIFVKKS
jgi:hypothetical protein